MEKKRNSIDPDFIARPAEPPRSSNTRALERNLSSLPAPPVPALPVVPDVFDEARIKYEMSRLAGTPGFSKYVAMLKSKFSRSMERKVLEHWEQFYKGAQRTLKARTDMIRAQHDLHQVEREYEIKDKQKDLACVKLDADIEEQRLRVDLARASRRELQQATAPPQASRAGYGNDNDSALLTQWYQQARKMIMEDRTLSIDEQDQLLEQLRAEYNARKRNITIDIG